MMLRRILPLVVVAASACSTPPGGAPAPQPVTYSIIPRPATVSLDPSRSFVVDTTTAVHIDATADSATAGVAAYLREMLFPFVRVDAQRSAAGTPLPVRAIGLRIDAANTTIGDEGYEINSTPDSVVVVARTSAGLFHGVQTIRQLLPWSVEHRAAFSRRLTIPAGRVVDSPRFEWRGMMLDVSRHFLPVRDVKRFIDLLSLYKLNRLHLHLADDQGWRIEIQSRPTLTAIGGGTQVGGGPGGFYTQADYRDIVSYAASRFITIVPEIDMPGHTNAALASIPELNCNKTPPPLYTGTRVGFSALCVDSAAIYPVLEDIVREISSLTPGPYFHIGGDEVRTLSHTQYRSFIERMQTIVSANGKRMIGWGEISPANLDPSAIVQTWIKDSSAVHAARGGKVILSPSPKMYLDMKYDSSTVLGLMWAGIIPLRTTYEWDPGNFTPGVGESSVLGVEAPLWAETVVKVQDYEYMAFPRIIAVSELGWTRANLMNFEDFTRRLDMQRQRLSALGVNFPRD